MFDPKIIDDILKNLSNAMPSGVKDFEQDLQKKFRQVLQDAFIRLDLVSREEFDVQTKVLARTRAKLEELEKQIAELEAKQQK